MNTKSELRELDDEELSAVQGGMSCAAGAHIKEVTIEARERDQLGRFGAELSWPLDLRRLRTRSPGGQWRRVRPAKRQGVTPSSAASATTSRARVSASDPAAWAARKPHDAPMTRRAPRIAGCCLLKAIAYRRRLPQALPLAFQGFGVPH